MFALNKLNVKKKEEVIEMKKILYQFKIGSQFRESSNQSDLREGIIKLLDIAPIQFKLDSATGNDNYKRNFPDQTFTFETQDEARQFALKILRTGVIFFCELKEVEVQ